jgi:hypothetical protein
MVTLNDCSGQEEVLSRQQRRNLERKAKKLEKRILQATKRTNLPVTFDNPTVTSFGPFTYFEAFKTAVAYPELLTSVTIPCGPNVVYSNAKLLDTLTDTVALGMFRFSHMQALQDEPVYKEMKGTDTIADESTLRYRLGKMTAENILQLQQVNQGLLELQAGLDVAKEVWLDFDDTVITLFGEQEGGQKGYNPRYPGRMSYKMKVGFVSEVGSLLHMGLYPGKTACNKEFLAFMKESLDMLPSNWVAKGVRMDSGFFDEKNLSFLEELCLEYVCKAKQQTNVKKMIAYIGEQSLWEPLDETFSVSELDIPLPSWEKARRFVFVRRANLKVKENLFPEYDYTYQVMVTNMTLPAADVWRWYNKRCNVENKIDELKQGLALDQAGQQEMLENAAFSWIKALAYNLVNWFKQAVLPDSLSSCETPTIRRTVFRVAGNVVGCGRYRHIRLAPNGWLESVLAAARENLNHFFRRRSLLTVLNG